MLNDIYQTQLLLDLKRGLPLRAPKVYTTKENVTVIDDRSFLRIAAATMRDPQHEQFIVSAHDYTPHLDTLVRIAKVLDRPMTVYVPLQDPHKFAQMQGRIKAFNAQAIHTAYPDFQDVESLAYHQAQKKGTLYTAFNHRTSAHTLGQELEQLNLHHGAVWVAEGSGIASTALRHAFGKNIELYIVDVARHFRAQFNGSAAQIIACDTPFAQSATITPPFLCNPFFEGKAWNTMNDHYALRKKPEGGVYFYNSAFQ
ncbi:MAG: hypothetical protein WC043_06820 [Pseudobdellovibrionaceae bacterium]